MERRAFKLKSKRKDSLKGTAKLAKNHAAECAILSNDIQKIRDFERKPDR